MNLGKLDRQLLLQAPVPVAQDGFGQPAPAQWQDVATVWGQLGYPKPGTETFEAQQLTATQPVSFTIRYRPDVRPTWQVLFEGTTYHITDVQEIPRRAGLILTTYRRG